MHSSDDKEFFNDWIGRIISFDNSERPSTWRLEEKLKDKNDQISAEDYNVPNENNVLYMMPSGAYGTFRCQNIHDPSDVGLIKIIMQIPYAGSEYASPSERAKQATDSLRYNGQAQIWPLETLTKNNCSATPLIREHVVLKQNDTGSVPGGFLHYILMDYAPGLRLSRDIFWGFKKKERARIRKAFREAWEECRRSGVIPGFTDISNLFWDSEADKFSTDVLLRTSFITGFYLSDRAEGHHKWTDTEWLYWELAQDPEDLDEGFEEAYYHRNTSNWIF